MIRPSPNFQTWGCSIAEANFYAALEIEPMAA